MEGSVIQNVSWDRQRRALRRKAGIPVQTLGSSGRQLSREVTWSDTGLRKVRLACKSTTVKCPLPPSPRPLKAMVSIGPPRLTAPLWPGPLPGMFQDPPQGSTYPCLHSSPPSTPHSKVHPATFQGVDLLQAGRQGQESNLACPQAQGRPVPRTSCCDLFPEHSPPLPRLQVPPSEGSPWVTACKSHSLWDT